MTREEVFGQQTLNPEMNPFGVRVRESRDSTEHPNSVGIVFGLDQTGSMQRLPEILARRELPEFMNVLLQFMPDPQVMFMGIGDAEMGEVGALQAGQFESETGLVDRWLTRIYLEGKGGGNDGESYLDTIYFAARHTSMDCFEKRGRRGYLFITGDEPYLQIVDRNIVARVIGDQLPAHLTPTQVVQEAQRTFHIFFLIPDQNRRRGCEAPWRQLLGDNVICLDGPEDTCVAAACLVGLTEGTLADTEVVEAKLRELGRPAEQIARVLRAVTPYARTLPSAAERLNAGTVTTSSVNEPATTTPQTTSSPTTSDQDPATPPASTTSKGKKGKKPKPGWKL